MIHQYFKTLLKLSKTIQRFSLFVKSKIMKAHRPEVVLHAAAHKHVPLIEATPWEAVFDNIQGSFFSPVR